MHSKVKKIWNFITSQAAGSSGAPSDFNPNEDAAAAADDAADDGNDQYDAPNVGDGSYPRSFIM